MNTILVLKKHPFLVILMDQVILLYISKKKARKKESSKRDFDGSRGDSNPVSKQDFDELRNIVTELAMLQKKNKRRSSSEGRSRGSGTKVIVVPQPASQQQNKPMDDYMEKLRKSIFD
jgi:hypothetical protein